MNILKKFVAAAVLIGCVLASSVSVSAGTAEITTMPSEQEIITTVGILGIMNGDYYGDLHLDKPVTRAEFTKIAVCTSALKDSVDKSSRISPFSDVVPSHWASGYIVSAVSAGYLRGYIDGSFKPDKTVTLEEAVTVMLRILGYSELDSGKYPDAQLAKYDELNMGIGIAAGKGEAMTRRDCMYLAYNTLCTETVNGNVYCQTLGYTADSNHRIDYLNLINDNMEGPVTVDTAGTYTEKVRIEYANATFYRDGKPATASDLEVYDQIYFNRDVRTIWAYSDKTMGIVNSVSVAGVTSTSSDYTGKAATSSGGVSASSGSQTFTSSTHTYSDGSVSTSSSVSGNGGYNSQGSGSEGYSSSYSSQSYNLTASSGNIIVNGTSYKLGNQAVLRKFSYEGTLGCDDFVMLMFDKDGNVGDAVLADKAMFEKYITDTEEKTSITDASIKGPYTVLSDNAPEFPFDTADITVYIKGKKATVSEIEKFDIYYYSVPLRTVWVYRDSRAGLVNSVNVGGVITTSDNYSGNTANVGNSVVVGGNTYTFGNDDVKYKFSAYGSISVDELVMLLFDRNGNVADAVILDGSIDGFFDDDDDRTELINATLKGPYTASESGKLDIPFDVESTEITLKGKKISVSDIEKYDIYYYSVPFSAVWVYRDSKTGLVNSVNTGGVVTKSENYSGNAASYTDSVIIDGKTYTLGNEEVKYKFSVYGDIRTDDWVTVMFDKGGNIADAVIIDGDISDYLDDEDDRVELINSTLKGPYVVKNSDSIRNKVPFSVENAKIYYGTELVSENYIRTNDIFYYSEPFASIWIYRDTATGFVNGISPSRQSPTSVTVGQKSYTLDGTEIKQQFSDFGSFDVDDFVTLHLGKGGTAVYATAGDIYEYAADNDDGVTFADLVNQSMEGPVTVKPGTDYEAKIPFELSGATVYKNNSRASVADIKDYDVLYYSKALSSVWIYSEKSTGTFESAAPNRVSPSSVTVSGRTYTIESSAASFAFSNFGSYRYGDTVTLLLGKNGGVVEVIPGSENADVLYGFITAFGEGTYTRPNGTPYTADNITVLGVDAQSYTYEYGKSGFTKGDFVSVTYTDGKIRIAKAASGVNAAEVASVNSMISEGRIADGAVLLDVCVTSDSDSIENKTVTYKKLYPSRLAGVKLRTSDIYFVKTENDMITVLVLLDFTGDMRTYGIVTAEPATGGPVYSMINGNGEKEIVLYTGYGIPSPGAAVFTVKGGKYAVKNLEGTQVKKEDFQRGYSISGGITYNYASDVQYYIKTDVRDFIVTTYDDISEGDYNITVYYDDTAENGGRVRIVIAE